MATLKATQRSTKAVDGVAVTLQQRAILAISIVEKFLAIYHWMEHSLEPRGYRTTCLENLEGKLTPIASSKCRDPITVKCGEPVGRVERAPTQRPEDLPTKTAPQLADPPGHAETLSKSGGDPEPGLSAADQVSDQPQALPSVPHGEDTHGTPGSMTPSPAESEMLSRAIGMIRSALVKKKIVTTWRK